MAKRCVAYCRVSTNQEKQKTSIESQKQYYEQKFEGDGYLPSQYGMLYRKDGTIKQIPALYIDEGISGTCIAFRKAFERMIEDARLGKFDIIYVKSVSRFARNTVDGLKTVEDLRAIGVGIIFEDCGVNSIDPENDMTLTVLLSVAQKESQTKSTNVKWGIRQRQKAGKWFCNAPFGYDKVEGGLVINEEEADTVKEIYRLYTEDCMSATAIGRYLNTMPDQYPTKTGALWSKQQVRGILCNSIYVGLYHMHTEEKKGYKATDGKEYLPEKEHYIHDMPELRIISDEVYEKATNTVKARAKKYTYNGGRNTSKHLFSTMIYCRRCNTAFVRKHKRGGKRKDGTRASLGFFWGCRNYEQYGKEVCDNQYGISEEEATEQVQAEIRRLQYEIKNNNGGGLAKNFEAYLKVRYELDHEAESIAQIKEDLIKIERKKGILLEDRADGLMSKELYQKEVKALNDEAEELEARLKANDYYEDTIARERKRFEKYKKAILKMDVNNLSNNDLKQVFDKLYVGAAKIEGKVKPRKYLIYSYRILGCTPEELLDEFLAKGYSGELNVTVNGSNADM